MVYLTREPGGNGCSIAEKIRQILKDPEHTAMAPETELFLFLAARAQHVKKHVIPHLELNYIVICDRFFGSTLAYQHFGRGLFNLEEVKNINRFATGGLVPDLTILFDIEPEKGLERRQLAGKLAEDRFDSEALAFHQKIRNGFLSLSNTEPNWEIINAGNSIPDVQENIWRKVANLLDVV